MNIIGALILVAGLVVGIYFWAFFDASVEVPRQKIMGQVIGGERVNNIGLLQQKQTGTFLGFGLAVIGLILALVGAGKRSGVRARFANKITDNSQSKGKEPEISDDVKKLIQSKEDAVRTKYAKEKANLQKELDDLKKAQMTDDQKKSFEEKQKACISNYFTTARNYKKRCAYGKICSINRCAAAHCTCLRNL